MLELKKYKDIFLMLRFTEMLENLFSDFCSRKIARAVDFDLPFSIKLFIEICRYLEKRLEKMMPIRARV